MFRYYSKHPKITNSYLNDIPFTDFDYAVPFKIMLSMASAYAIGKAIANYMF
jgi:hypothetical protein